MLERRKTAFLCSRRTPDGVAQAIEAWLRSLNVDTDCIVCGNQSDMERRVLSWLLRRGMPTILVLAQAMPEAFGADLQTAMQAGRLLVISHCDASVHWADARTARDRNLLMLGMANEVVVGFCTKGGNLWRQLTNIPNVRVLFQEKGEYKPAQGVAGGMAREPQPARGVQPTARWKRRMWSVNKAVTIELDDSEGEPCFRIWQEIDFDIDGINRFDIVLSPQEMTDFHEALGEVVIQVSKRRLSDVRAMTVSASGGNVTFDFKMLTSDGVLKVTQSVETKFMGLRRKSVLLNALEIKTFYTKVSEAVEKAKEVMKDS